MTDDEIIAVIQARKEGKRIEVRYGKDENWGSWCSCNPSWNFHGAEYRVAPEPRKPREFWLREFHWTDGGDPFFKNASPGTIGAIHVREVIDDSEDIKKAFRKAVDCL